jgi:hypothetical protein
MNNIEKFEKLKQLQQLKVDYHKRNMGFTVKQYTTFPEGTGIERVLKFSKLAFNIYRFFKK